MTLGEMDRWGVERGLIGVGDPVGHRGGGAASATPTGSSPRANADPNDGMEGIARLVREYETFGVRAVGVFPAGTFPQVPDQRQEDVPDLRQVRRAGDPGLLLRRRSRARASRRPASTSSSSTR